MRKILAIGGVPGTGKTTLMKAFMSQFEDWKRIKPLPTVECEYSKKHNIYIIGKYDEGEIFGGTDKLSLAVQPKAIEFVRSTNSNIIFEGDRLFNGSFLRELIALPDTELKVILLTAPTAILHERYKERGSNQSAEFLQSRVTKYGNLQIAFDLMDVIEERENLTLEDGQKTLNEILAFFS